MAFSRPTQGNLDSLIKAAEQGDVDVLQYMIKKKNYDVDTRGSRGFPYWNRTLLHISCWNGKIKAVEKLLQLGANINAVDENWWTPLHVAAYNGHLDVAKLILMKPEMIKQTDNDGWTPLHTAVCWGHVDMVDLLLKHNPEVITQTDNNGSTPLDIAVITDKSAVVWTMVHNHKADITKCCKQRFQEKAKRLLAAEEERRAKSTEEDANASAQESLEVMLAKLDQAKANNETLKVSYTTVVFSGSSGVGKTSLLSKLNKEKLNKHHHSTGVAKSKHTICVKTTAVIKSNQGLQWTDLDYDSMISHLHKYLHHLKFPSLASSQPQKNGSTDYNSQVSSLNSTSASSPKDNPSNTTRSEDAGKKTKEVEVDIAKADSSNTPSLGDVWDIINFLDTGGQPEFVNILPAVSSSIALTFIVFNLHESLDGLVHVKHNVNGDPSFEPYYLDCTNLEFIKRLMVSSGNFNKDITPSVVLKGIQRKGDKNSSKICYVGTHAVNVSEDKIEEVDQRLSSIAKELELQQRSFWCSPKHQLKRLFPIDLFPADKELESFENIIEDIRDNIQKEVKTQDYYEVPITWFIFLLKLQKLCNVKNANYVSYQEAVDVWMDENVKENELGLKSNQGLYKDRHGSVSREKSEVHNTLLFFHLMGMLFYYHKVKGMCDFVFINRQWLFEKLTELVEIKFKGYNKKDISAEDFEKFTMEGRLSINIIENLKINLQEISPLCFIHLLDHLNIVAPIDTTEYFMPCVLPSFSPIKSSKKVNDLEEYYGAIQYVSLLVGFKNGPMPHGFFCHLIVQLFKNLPTGWIPPFLSTEEVQHVYNNLITFSTSSGHFVSLFYKIGYLEIQVRHKQSHPTVIHSKVQHELDKALRKVCDHLQLNKEQLRYGFYCNCERIQHFAKLNEITAPTEYIHCRYGNTELTEYHRVWLKNIYCHQSQQGSKLIKIGQPNYQNLLPYFEGVDDWKQLGMYLLPEDYTSRINDIHKNHKQDVAECRWALITEYLKVGEVSWDKVIYAVRKSGHSNIAEKIRRDIFNNDGQSTKPSTDHERHEQSPITIASDVDVSTKPLTGHQRPQQSSSTIAFDADVSAKPLGGRDRHKQSPDATASDTDLCAKPSTDRARHVQSHSTAAPQPSTKRKCLVM